MSYSFRSDRNYRMPTHFGPSLGPRQGPDGKSFAGADYSKATTLTAVFEANPAQLETFIPPGFVLRAPYLVKVEFCYTTDIAWLAGRGYNTFGIYVPARYQGKEDTVEGEFLLVLWENMADPIITGREELGFAKLYCEIPEAQYLGDRIVCRASWDGFQFASFEFSELETVKSEALPKLYSSRGMLHYKYFPRTGVTGCADVAYAALTPAEDPEVRIDKTILIKQSKGHFCPSTWEELPTLMHIVNALASLELGTCVGASLVKTHGRNGHSQQRILI